MKQATFLLIIVLFITIGCHQKTSNLQRFSSQTDTLFLQSIKIKGDSLFDVGASNPMFRDTTAWKGLEGFNNYPDYTIVFPDSVKNIELGFISLMVDTLKYFDTATKQIFYQKNYSLADRQILMIKGLKEDKEVFMIDQNNNKNFKDDTLRTFQEWNWKSAQHLIPVHYDIDYGNKKIQETGWYKIGLFRGGLLNSSSQFLLSRFSIDDQEFAIGVADENRSTFGFMRPLMVPFIENGISRDTLITGDMLKEKEYIKLGNHYYQFADLYNGSGTIVLVKENNFNNLVGTQIGMIAPSPDFKTTIGKQSNLKDFSDKPVLIVNISGCTPRSYDQYKAIIDRYSASIDIIGVEHDIKNDMGGLMVDISDSINADFYKAYRNAYSCYDCYLIDKEKRIIDKFDVFDWEKTISKHLNDKE